MAVSQVETPTVSVCDILVCVFAAAGSDWQESEVLNSTQGFYSLAGLQPGSQYHLKIIHGNNTHWEGLAFTMGPGMFVSRL